MENFKIKFAVPLFFSLIAVFFYFAGTPKTFAAICAYDASGNVTGSLCSTTGSDGQDCLTGGLNWFFQNVCITNATLQARSMECFNSRRTFDGVTGCTNNCRVTGEVPCGSSCRAPVSTTFCDGRNRVINECATDPNGCGDCRSGFVDFDGDGVCEARCNANTELFVPGTGCVTLQSVSTRVEAIENLQLCHFDATGAYVNDQGQMCPQDFDPTNINGQLSTIQTRFSALMRMIARIIPEGEITNTLALVLTGNDVATSFTRLTALLLASPVLTVRRALVAESLEDRSLNFADFGMTCASGQVVQFDGTNWVCGDMETGGGGGGGAGGTAPSVFVGFTTVKRDDEWGGSGYRPVNNFCLNGPWESGYGDLTGSHVCSAMEIINSYRSADIAARARMGNAAGVAWIFNGPPAHLNTLVNDCSGWQVVGNDRYGAVWNFDNDRGLIQQCDSDLKFACCR